MERLEWDLAERLDRAGWDEAMTIDRTGLLIIRAWIEEGSSKPLRAQVRISTDVSNGFERTLTLAEPEAVRDTVLEWLDQITKGAERTD